MVVFGTTVLDRWFEKNLKFFSEAKATVLPHGSGGTVFRLNRDGLGHPATGAWKVCPRCRVVFRNLSASDVRPPADGRGMPVRT